LQRLTERTFYGVPTLSGLPIRKLFKVCKAAAEELFREERGNELQSNLREMMRLVKNLSDLIHCFVPLELYLTTKRSLLPALVLPSSPP